MSDIEKLVIDNHPKIKKMTLETEFNIDTNSEISISINNFTILGYEDIYNIKENIIFIDSGTTLDEKDTITVIYNRI